MQSPNAQMPGTLVVYIGTHGDAGAHRADVILPAAAYTEKNATYVNTEGRVQVTARAVFPPGEAKEDWTIIRALSAVVGQALPFNSLPQLRAALYGQFPHLARIDEIAAGDLADVRKLTSVKGTGVNASFASPINDFYFTNPIARASAIMAECSATAAGLRQAAE